MSGDQSSLADERTPRGTVTPWLFLVGLLAVLVSAGLFVFDLVRGTDIVRSVALNAAGAAILVAVAAYDTRQDPDSVVTETTGAVGTALLLYGLYLFVSGLVIAATSIVHGRLVVGLWTIGFAVVSIVGGMLSFPTRTLLESQQQSAREQYERAVEACTAAAEHIDAGEYDRVASQYDEIETAVETAVRAADAIPDEEDESPSAESADAAIESSDADELGTNADELSTDADELSTDADELSTDAVEQNPASTVLAELDEQTQAAVEAGGSHLDADEFGAATAAFTAAQRALATARSVAAATDTEQATDCLDREDEITAWVETTDGLATAAGAAEAGAVASALQALDEAGEAVTHRQQALFDRKRVAILTDVEATRRETAVERLAEIESTLDGESFTAVENTRVAVRGARAGIESLAASARERSDVDDAAETATALRERIQAWTTVTDRVTVGEAKLEEGDHAGVLELLEAALVAANACDGPTDPSPRQITAWLRGCERIMDAYGEATAAVETADDLLAAGDEGGARGELERALAAFDTSRTAATESGIDTTYIDREAREVTERLASIDADS